MRFTVEVYLNFLFSFCWLIDLVQSASLIAGAGKSIVALKGHRPDGGVIDPASSNSPFTDRVPGAIFATANTLIANQGLDHRLTGVEKAKVAKEILA